MRLVFIYALIVCGIVFLTSVARGQQDPADIPPISIQQTGITSLMELRENYECTHPDGVLFREHWLACGYFSDFCVAVAGVLTAQRDYALMKLDECLNPPEPPPPEGPNCDVNDSFFDGRGGDLWKPVSDNTGNVVVLTKDGPSKNAVCEVFGPDGGLVDRCSFRTIANGDREHWNTLRCDLIPNNSVFRLTENGVSTCWDVPNPCNRLD